MNLNRNHELTQQAVKKKFGRKRYLRCRGKFSYPQAVEREYIRTVGRYLRPLLDAVKEYLPDLGQALQSGDIRMDDSRQVLPVETVRLIEETFRKISRRYASKVLALDLQKELQKHAGHANKLTVSEWKKAIRATLGIDIFSDYYDGAFYEGMLERWVDENVGLIQTIPQQTLGQMEQVVKEGFLSGVPTKEITRQIYHTYNVNLSHARLIARDQTGKLNAQLTQKQHRDAGITLYEWSDSGDSRVRSTHKALNGRTFSYDDPPVVDPKTGRRCNPGEDYQCRCVGYPVFDYETLNLPVMLK